MTAVTVWDTDEQRLVQVTRAESWLGWMRYLRGRAARVCSLFWYGPGGMTS